MRRLLLTSTYPLHSDSVARSYSNRCLGNLVRDRYRFRYGSCFVRLRPAWLRALRRIPGTGTNGYPGHVVPGIGIAAAQAGVDNTRENQNLIYEQLGGPTLADSRYA